MPHDCTTLRHNSEVDVGPYVGVVRPEQGCIEVWDADTLIIRLPANLAGQKRTLTLIAQVYDLGVEHGRTLGYCEAQQAMRRALGV